MAYNTQIIKRDLQSAPIPQYFNPTNDIYEVLLGRNGANRVELYGPDGNPISLPTALTAGGGLKVGLVDSIPAGANIIGQVKLTDGTDGLLINTNGSLNIVPVNSAGTELFTASNPGNVQLTGRKAQLSIVSQNPATTVPTGGGEGISIIATSGYLAKLQHIYFTVPAPNGATSGYHKLIIGIGTTTSTDRFYEIQAPYNQTLLFGFGVLGNGNTLIQPTDMAQVLSYRTGGIYYGASGKHLSLIYYNQTNVDQTNARIVKVVSLEEAII